jgi:hypothetical protein
VGVVRLLSVVVGTVLALAGVALTVAAALGLVLAEGDNTISTGSQRLSTPTAAIVSGSAELSGERPAGWLFDEDDELALRITAESTSSTPLFLGIAPTPDVDAFLTGAPYDEIDSISFRPFGIDYDRRGPPDGPPPPAPTEETFWTVRSEGASGTVQIDWDYAPGSYAVVLMNADGSPNVVADASLELEVPLLRTGLIAAIVIGALLLLLGLVLALFGGRRRRRAAGGQTPPGSDPAPGVPPPGV